MEQKEDKNVWAAAQDALSVPQRHGFTYEYTYDKSSDASCVYVHRFKKGRDKFELRVLAGAETLTVVAYVNGEYRFPNVQKQYKKEWRAICRRRLFKKPTEKELWRFYAAALEIEAKSGSMFGIPVDDSCAR